MKTRALNALAPRTGEGSDVKEGRCESLRSQKKGTKLDTQNNWKEQMTQHTDDLNEDDRSLSSTDLSKRKATTNKKTARQDLCTPSYIFNEISRRYGPFDIDTAASEDNALCDQYYKEEMNGLTQECFGRCWCNPPYKKMLPWVHKAIRSVAVEATCDRVVMLLPARVGTEWYKFASMWGVIHRVQGRIKFEKDGEPMKSPFEDSIIVVFEREINAKDLWRESVSLL